MLARKGRLLGLVTIVAAVIAAVIGLSQATAGAPTVSVDQITVADGDVGTVEVWANDINSPGLGAWEIGIIYDPSVVDALNCAPQAGSVCNPNFAPNQVRVTGASASGHEGDTLLARITFRCDEVDDTSLTVSIGVLSDATIGSPNPISAIPDHGGVNCIEPVPTNIPQETPVDPTDQPPNIGPTSGPSADDTPTAAATATPIPGKLPNVGSGGGTGSGGEFWLIAAGTLALIGAGTLGAWRWQRARNS